MQADYVLGRRQDKPLKICCLNGHLKNKREGSISLSFHVVEKDDVNGRKATLQVRG